MIWFIAKTSTRREGDPMTQAKENLTTFEQEIYERLCDLAERMQELLSSEPDMPSHDRTYKEAEEVLDNLVQWLKDEDLLPDFLQEDA